jgi:serine protease Do
MKTWIRTQWNTLLKRRVLATTLAMALVASFTTYEFLNPGAARAAAPAPAAAPLSNDSVSALLALDHAMEAVAARVTPAVVNVAVTSRVKADTAEMQLPEEFRHFFGPGQRFFGQEMRPRPEIQRSVGSGVLISPDGYIVTNEHVVKGATDIRVTMSDRRVLTAKLIGTDPLTDVAVIKVNGTNLPSLPWGDSTTLRPGQTVLAFGNPFGFRFTVTRGIVSAVNRANPFSDDPRKPGGFIQTDAAINQGNSGGALVNAQGEVVGINTFLISPSGAFSGMGFAIPSQIVRPTVETLIRDGKVTHGYMGIGITDVTPENSKFFDMKEAVGAVVTQVEPDSPGAKAGLKTGDVITEVDAQKVSEAGQLQVIVGQKRPGTTIKLGLLRDGKAMTVPVTLEEMGSRAERAGETSGAEPGKARWGIGLIDLTPELRDQLQVPSNIHGAVVGNVQPGSSADDAGLTHGDIIAQVSRHDVQTAADVKEALSKVPKGQDVLLLIWSNGGSTYRIMHSPEGTS